MLFEVRIMKRSLFLFVGLFAASAVPVFGEDAPVVDEVGRKAAALEAELGKYKDSTSEAAEAMVKLADIYYADGRLFGLVRVAQQFVTSHPTDPRHRNMMLKLIDAQQGLSRNKDLSATIKQFMARYPDAPECAALEIRLADVLQQLDDRLHWPKPAEPSGCGRDRLRLAESTVSPPSSTSIWSVRRNRLFKLPSWASKCLTNCLPVNSLAKWGSSRFMIIAVSGNGPKAVQLGSKIFQKGLGGDPEAQRLLHLYLAENHANLGQQANSAQSYLQARAIRDDQLSLYYAIYRLYHAAAKPNELEPLVNQYVQKYPQRVDRFHCQSYLANSCIANGEKPRAIALLKPLLVEDPITNSNAQVFVRENGNEPPQFADTEQNLLQAIAQNKPGSPIFAMPWRLISIAIA